MKKISGILAALAVIAGAIVVYMNATTPKSTHSLVAYNDQETPDAWGKFQVDADQIVLLADATKQKVFGGNSTIALVGKTVKIRCSQYLFSVEPTIKGEVQTIHVYDSGDEVEITKNGRYTVLIYRSPKDVQPVGMSYVIKTDLESIKQRRQEMNTPLSDNPDIRL